MNLTTIADDIDPLRPSLPPIVLKQILGYSSRANQYSILKECKSKTLSEVATAALYTYLLLESPERVHRLMKCQPDPSEIAGFVEWLAVPDALDPPAREYIAKLIKGARNVEILKIGSVKSNDSSSQYIPDPPERSRLRTLFVAAPLRPGEHSRDPVSIEDRIVDLSELSRFPYITQLHWCPVDPRIGSVQQVLAAIDDHCPRLKFLEAPWSDRLDQTPWASLPPFKHLVHMGFRFDHDSQINVPEFVKCLREFYRRGIAVKVGSGCRFETHKWKNELFKEIYVQEIRYGDPPVDMLRWVIQHNRNFNIIQLNEFRSKELKTAVNEAMLQVDDSDGGTFAIETDLTPGGVPDILKRNLRYICLVVNRQNIDPHHIPDIIESNSKLASIIVAIHVKHHGGSHDGNCTVNKIPLLPNQDVARNSGFRSTIPGIELKYRVQRDPRTGRVSQLWRSYPSVRRGPPPSSAELNHLNVFGSANFVEQEWSETLLNRLHKWEDEIKSWLGRNPKLRTITVVINTVHEKFGRLERYWCTCHEQE
jgi:hypothetical protein